MRESDRRRRSRAAAPRAGRLGALPLAVLTALVFSWIPSRVEFDPVRPAFAAATEAGHPAPDEARLPSDLAFDDGDAAGSEPPPASPPSAAPTPASGPTSAPTTAAIDPEAPAGPLTRADPEPRLVADPVLGATKAAMCAGCHGPDGNALMPLWPKLAGQRPDYIEKQLRDFRGGRRADPMMSAMAAPLSDQDIVDIAAHFSTREILPGAADPALASLGKQLYDEGRTKDGLMPCVGCHGSRGEGFSGSLEGGFPALGGQNPDYLVKQLESFRAGARSNDWESIMQGVAGRLSDRDIRALTAYLSSLSRSAE